MTVQVAAILIGSLTQIVTKNVVFSVIPDICSPTQKDSFTCPYTRVWYNSGVLWYVPFMAYMNVADPMACAGMCIRGGIGVQRIFGMGALYHPITWALLIGAFLPVPFWWLSRKYPKRFWKAVNWTVILNSITAIPPANGSNYAGFFLAGFVFRKFPLMIFVTGV
jgi:hypothetical protein